LGELAGKPVPLAHVTAWLPLSVDTGFCQASVAVTVSLNAVPAVGDGVERTSWLYVPAAGANAADVPVWPAGAVTEVTLIVVDCALNKVTDPVATPAELNVRELFPTPQLPAAGYVGAVPLGLFVGPLKVTQSVAENHPGTRFPEASAAVMVSVNGTLTVDEIGCETVNVKAPAAMVKVPEEPDMEATVALRATLD
jgi:hypothetical protein